MALEDGQVGKLNVEVSADTSRYEPDLKTAKRIAQETGADMAESFEKSSKRTSKSLKTSSNAVKDFAVIARKELDGAKIASNLESFGGKATMFVTAPLLAAGVAATGFASDMEETTSKINVVFQENANSVIEWSNTTIESYGLASQTALDMTATFGDMATSMGFTTSAAADMGTQLVARAADLASFKNIQIDVAKTALNGVFTGETESLKQLGVVMTQANLELFAMNQGITKSIKQMSQQEKVALRLAYVMDATANAQGDFARTGDSTANQARKNKEQLKQLAVTVGTDLLPVANELLGNVSKITSAFNDMSPAGRKVVLALGLTAAAAGPASLAVGKVISGTLALKASLGLTNQELSKSTIQTLTNTAAQKGQGAALFQAGLMATGKASATTALGIAETAATPPTYALGTAVKFLTGPAGIVIGLLGVAIPLVAGLGKKSEEATDGTEALADTTQALNETLDNIDMSAIETEMDSLMVSTEEATATMDEMFKVDFNQFAENVAGGVKEAKEYIDQLAMPDAELAEGSVFAVLQRSALDFGEVTTQAVNEALEVAKQYRDESLQVATDKYNAEIALAYAEFDKNKITQEQLDERVRILNTSYESEKETVSGHFDEMLLLVNQYSGNVLETYNATKDKQAEINEQIEQAEKDNNNKLVALSIEHNNELERKQLEFEKNIKDIRDGVYDDEYKTSNEKGMAIYELKKTHDAEMLILEEEHALKIEEATKLHNTDVLALQEEHDKLMETEEYEKGDAIVAAQEENFKLYKDSFDETFGTMPAHWEALGEDSAQGLVIGLKNKIPDVMAAARELAEAANRAYKEELDQHSPSRLMIATGRDTAEGIVIGLQSKIPDIAAVSQQMARVASAGLQAVSNTYNNSTTNQHVNQTINYTSKPMTLYEQIVMQRRASKNLAANL